MSPHRWTLKTKARAFGSPNLADTTTGMESLSKSTSERLQNLSTIRDQRNPINKAPIQEGVDYQTVRILTWNAQSLNNIDKINFIRSLDQDLIVLTEIWHPSTIVTSQISNYISNERNDQRGGGTMIIGSKNVHFLKKIPANEDSMAVKLQIDTQKSFWIILVYLNKGGVRQLQNLFNFVLQTIPTEELDRTILIGDWNIDILGQGKPKDCLQGLARQLGMTISTPNQPTRGPHLLDYAVNGKKISIEHSYSLKAPSDHRAVVLTMKISNTGTQSFKIRLPNVKLACEITEKCLNKCTNSKDFLDMATALHNANKGNKFVTIEPRKPRNDLLAQLLEHEELEDIKLEIRRYWESKIQENETQRFSQQQKEAFSFLKRVYKYNTYEKRDGSVVRSFMLSDGTIISNEKEISKILIRRLKEIQYDSNEPLYTTPLPFPRLPKLEKEELEDIINRLSSGKASSFDLLSDIMFKEPLRSQTAAKLGDLWSIDLNSSNIIKHFQCRLIPLNKDHPKIPKPDRFRPIIVSSPLVKLLEARFLPKLNDYLLSNIHKGQTGFIKGCGIMVNINRALNRILMRTSNNIRIYGIFIDFSNAYNTIKHQKLFKDLEKVLGPEETKFIQAIYSRNTIIAGNYKLRPNIGVSQGSVISPSLFNIYLDEFLRKIADFGIEDEDILAYADDLLILTPSYPKLRALIDNIQRWSQEIGLHLNKSKSGIMEFIPRRKRRQIIQESISGIPIVKKYKYLGLWMNSKLTMDDQIDHILSKSTFILHKLYPILEKVSLDYRTNLWRVFIEPLFLFTFPLLGREDAEYRITRLERVFKQTIKKFMLLKKTVPDRILNRLVDIDIKNKAGELIHTSECKWEAYKQNKIWTSPKAETELKAKGLPRNLVNLLNIYTMICPLCTPSLHVMNARHLKEKHEIQVTPPEVLLQYFKEKPRTQRQRLLNENTEIIERELSTIKSFLNSGK